MAAVLDIVTDALREIGVLAAGEVASADEATSGMDALNRLVDQWAAERLAVYEVARTTFTITSSTQAYAVGTGQTVAVARPIYPERLAYTDSSVSPVHEVGLEKLTWDGWAGIPQKSLTSEYPTHWFYATDYPYASIKLWPIPTSSTLTGVLYHPKQISEFAALATTVSLPPGYRRLFIKNLALELAPSYGRQPSPALVQQAMNATAVVKRSNLKMRDLSFDPGSLVGGGQAFDIEEG